MIEQTVIEAAGRRLATAAGMSAQVLVVGRTHADASRDLRGSVVHSSLAQGRVVAG